MTRRPAAGDGAWQAYLLLTTATLCWAGNAILSRVAVGDVSPMLLVTARWLGVTLLCGVFFGPRIAEHRRVLLRHLPFLATIGGLGFTCFNALFYAAAHTTTALNIGVLQGAIPVFVLIGAYLAHGSRITRLQLVGVLTTVTGVIVAASRGSLERLLELSFQAGDLMMIAASVLYAVYAVALRHRPRVPAVSQFAVMAASAFVVSLPFTAAELAFGNFLWPTPTGWLVILLVTLFPSFLAQIFFIHGVDRIGPGRAGVFVNLVPVFAAIMAVVLLGEAFHGFHAVALAMVLGGIGMSERFEAVSPAEA